MKEYNVISAWVWDPNGFRIFGKKKKSDKALFYEVSCSNKDNCDLFKNGQCALLDVELFSHGSCPYGNRTRQVSPGQRAKSYYTWMSEKREMSVDIGIKSTHGKLAIVGDYVFFPYSYLSDLKEVPLENKFIPLEKFSESLPAIFEYRPRPMFGYGIIKDYPKKELPKMAQHIKEVMPNLLKEHPFIKDYLPKSHIGRKAYLHSLRANTEVTCSTHGTKWMWDGETLNSIDASPSFMPIKFSEATIVLTPKDGETIEVTEDSQVDENTQFAN